jgi:putative sigma-54 modulation protein
MRIQVKFHNIKPSSRVESYARERFGKAAKYLIKRGQAELYLTREGHQFQVEVTFLTGGQPIHASGTGVNLYAAIDAAAERVTRQGTKIKDKVQNHKNPRRSREERIRYLQEQLAAEHQYFEDEDDFSVEAA